MKKYLAVVTLFLLLGAIGCSECKPIYELKASCAFDGLYENGASGCIMYHGNELKLEDKQEECRELGGSWVLGKDCGSDPVAGNHRCHLVGENREIIFHSIHEQLGYEFKTNEVICQQAFEDQVLGGGWTSWETCEGPYLGPI